MKRLAVLASACVATIACAQQKSMTDQTDMDKLLSSIPVNSLAMPYKNLLERFDSLGITAKHMMFGAVTADEVQINSDKIKRGDVLYRFTSTEPSERAKKDCSFLSSFTLTKRGNRWLVESRTANYLLQNQYSLPKSVLWKKMKCFPVAVSNARALSDINYFASRSPGHQVAAGIQVRSTPMS